MAELAEGTRLLSEYTERSVSRVRIPLSPPQYNRGGLPVGLAGEMAERLKAVASKAIVRIADRGFESLSLRHSTHKILIINENFICSWQAMIR